ncbi:MAG: hypothetical protein Ct9H300mP18_02730 [Candidatus Neomarinimicrobiota bacterium]|nr:MAG: hypothetical protein Ct9H300mP18_02730 [Candidatus Neomarinimicrobiota bacterium]
MFLAKLLLVSILATSFFGATHGKPSSSIASTRPFSKGFSGPIMAKSIASFLATATIVWFSERGAIKYFSHKTLMCGLIEGTQTKKRNEPTAFFDFSGDSNLSCPRPNQKNLAHDFLTTSALLFSKFSRKLLEISPARYLPEKTESSKEVILGFPMCAAIFKASKS